MIKFLARWFPVNEAEILTVVLQVAPNTVFPVRIPHLKPRMIPLGSGKCLRHLLVTFEAFKGWRAGPERMAGGALGRAA